MNLNWKGASSLYWTKVDRQRPWNKLLRPSRSYLSQDSNALTPIKTWSPENFMELSAFWLLVLMDESKQNWNSETQWSNGIQCSILSIFGPKLLPQCTLRPSDQMAASVQFHQFLAKTFTSVHITQISQKLFLMVPINVSCHDLRSLTSIGWLLLINMSLIFKVIWRRLFQFSYS